MLRPVALAALLLTLLFAGCADDPGADGAEPEPEAFDDVQVTDTTGAIRGIVVSEAIVPIPDVLVQLVDGRNQTTDAEGAFVFNGLEPGDYFVTATKAGYITQQQSATVVAGDKLPPITKILLPVSTEDRPFTELYQWSGFLQCGAWAFVVTTNPCAFTGSDNVHDFPWSADRIPDFFQAEAIFTGTQPTGNWLDFSVNDPNGLNTSCFGVNSESPAILNNTQDAIIDCEGDKATKITLKIFPGATEGTPPTPTILANQQYDIYVQYFFGFVPRAGYTLAADGVCDIPEKCS
jgi:hypothetical protein